MSAARNCGVNEMWMGCGWGVDGAGNGAFPGFEGTTVGELIRYVKVCSTFAAQAQAVRVSAEVVRVSADERVPHRAF
jgi:hypothetical protein